MEIEQKSKVGNQAMRRGIVRKRGKEAMKRGRTKEMTTSLENVINRPWKGRKAMEGERSSKKEE